ncbi:MAG: hypothetical protein IKD55_05590 [Sediminibacterium sp.]|jgi:hypothetical protein|nr:hypothetical protein [Sediminibacterium sp.]MBX9779922.1 hypothetical protein [Chitinophagaceae bacterium]MCA6440815.1 hypothetical protein [Chitinophagaceae bacterium]MCA6446012.1 hypothetical protein [Chitinophagaceae bacterium]
MNKVLLILFLSFSKSMIAQYKIDPQLKKEFFNLYKKLQSLTNSEFLNEYKDGISLFYKIKEDTLNKQDIIKSKNNIEVYTIDTVTGEIDTTDSQSTNEPVPSKQTPYPFYCVCEYQRDTLVITTGIAIFGEMKITSKLIHNKLTANYTESDSNDTLFKRTLSDDRLYGITIPAKIKSLNLNVKPHKNIPELFGKMRIVTNGYYYYANVYGFKNDYIYQRMNFEFLFRCHLKNPKKIISGN